MAGTLSARQDLIRQAFRAGLNTDEIARAVRDAGLDANLCFILPPTENDNVREPDPNF